MGERQLLRDMLADDALLVTPEEAAALLRVGRATVYALMKAGELRPVQDLRLWTGQTTAYERERRQLQPGLQPLL